MTIEQIYRKQEQATQKWIDAISQFSDEQFAQKPPNEEWSMAELCDHVLAASGMFIQAAHMLTLSKGQQGRGGLKERIFLGLGSFPPFRFKIPIKNFPKERRETLIPKVIDKKSAIDRFNAALKSYENYIGDINEEAYIYKRVHPLGLWFNGPEWLQYGEMHTRHHIKQLKRIKRSLNIE